VSYFVRWQDNRMSGTPDELQPKKRRKKRRASEADVGLFLRQHGRKAHRGHDPNDRSYSRDVEKKIKRMKAEELDKLMHGDDVQPDDEPDTGK
jgi:hypothetical protein